MSKPTDNQIKLNQLRQYQALPLKAKVRLSEMRIREWYDYFDGLVYIALSGGKDSCVMADIIWSLYPEVPAVFADTGNELDSIKAHIKSMIDDGRPITIVKPKMSYDEVVEKWGYPILSKTICMGISRFVNTKSLRQKILRINGGINPTSRRKQQRTIPKKWRYILRLVLEGKLKVTNKCCGILKINPTKPYAKRTGRSAFTGVMANESDDRLRSYMARGCNAFTKSENVSRPLMFWMEQDVLSYHVAHSLPIAAAYGDIVSSDAGLRCSGDQRTGCKFCLFGIQFEKGENRIQRLARIEPESYRHAIEDLHYDKVMDYLGIEWRPVDEVSTEEKENE